MTKWYDRIGNTIEMNISNQWIKGKVINGYRTHDGFINMETEDGKKCWCGSSGEGVHFRKCDDSNGDLISNADRIRQMTDEELAELLLKVNTAYAEPCMVSGGDCKYEDYPTHDKGCKDCFLEYLRKEVEG